MLEVSILILVDQSLEPLFSACPEADMQVSILILVDQSLEQLECLMSLVFQHRFNPYFSGSVTGTQTSLCYHQKILQFQSLF